MCPVVVKDTATAIGGWATSSRRATASTALSRSVITIARARRGLTCPFSSTGVTSVANSVARPSGHKAAKGPAHFYGLRVEVPALARLPTAILRGGVPEPPSRPAGRRRRGRAAPATKGAQNAGRAGTPSASTPLRGLVARVAPATQVQATPMAQEKVSGTQGPRTRTTRGASFAVASCTMFIASLSWAIPEIGGDLAPCPTNRLAALWGRGGVVVSSIATSDGVMVVDKNGGQTSHARVSSRCRGGCTPCTISFRGVTGRPYLSTATSVIRGSDRAWCRVMHHSTKSAHIRFRSIRGASCRDVYRLCCHTCPGTTKTAQVEVD